VVPDTLYVAFFIGGILFLLFLSFKRVADRGFGYELSVVTGEVKREQQRSETEISGSILGGGPTTHAGGYVRGSISSKTTRFQEIYVALPSGKEVRLDFVNFKVPCREGHRLSIVGVRRTDGLWRDCAYRNHATDDTVTLRDELYATLKPDVIWGIAGAWGLFAAAMALLTQWDRGELSAEVLVTTLFAVGAFGVIAALIVLPLAWLPVSWRTKRRCAEVEGEIQKVLAAAD
jgi:hypothetical protein